MNLPANHVIVSSRRGKFPALQNARLLALALNSNGALTRIITYYG